MKHHVVNRKCRTDRLLLWQGAMAAQRVPRDAIVVHVAMDKNDYPTREDVCHAGVEDGFDRFFYYHLDHTLPYIGYGMLIGSWSVMRMWREIANGDETVVAWVDDYALGVSYHEMTAWANSFELDIVQLAWHFRPDFFIREPNPHIPHIEHVPYPYLPWFARQNTAINFTVPHLTVFPVEGRKDIVMGAEGASDWALVLSPRGAQWLLDYMHENPVVNTEMVVAAFWGHNRHRQTLFSVRANDPTEHGLVEMRNNRWVVGLGHLTDTPSDLVGMHQTADLEEVLRDKHFAAEGGRTV